MRLYVASFSALLFGAPFSALSSWAAPDNHSVYTELKLDECDVLDRSADDEEGPGWIHMRCEGYQGIPVHIYGSDLRYVVVYGDGEPMKVRHFARFNELHTTLEWRLATDENGNRKPVATILRYFLHFEARETGGEPRDHPVLVVTQLKSGHVCHIAYVDAGANPRANEDARKAADRLAGSFDCSIPPERVGPQTPGLYRD